MTVDPRLYRNTAADMYAAAILGLNADALFDSTHPEYEAVTQAIDAAHAGQFNTGGNQPIGIAANDVADQGTAAQVDDDAQRIWQMIQGQGGGFSWQGAPAPGTAGHRGPQYNPGPQTWLGYGGSGFGPSMSNADYSQFDDPNPAPPPPPAAPPPAPPPPVAQAPNNSPPAPPPAPPPAAPPPAQARVPAAPVNIATVTQPTPHTGPTPSGAGNTNPNASVPQTDSNLAQTALTGLQNSPPAFDPAQLAQALQSWMQQYGTQPAAPSEMTGEAIDPAAAGTINRDGGGLAGLMSDSPYANGSMPSEAVSAGFAPLGGGIGSQRRPQTIKSGLAGLTGIG